MPAKKINLISHTRLKKYLAITEKALKIAEKNINPGKTVLYTKSLTAYILGNICD